MSDLGDSQENRESTPQTSMDFSTPCHPTTVGRVEFSLMSPMSPGQRTLAGTRNGTNGIFANSAKRRLHAPTLLGSPARRGYSPSMANIFNTTQANIKGINPLPAKSLAFSAERQTPSLHPRPVNQPNENASQIVQTAESDEGVSLYPKLPLEDETSPIRPFMLPSPVFGVEHAGQASASSRISPHRFKKERSPERARLSPSPKSKKHSFFKKPAQIAQAQIVAMNDIETAQIKPDLSDSSASWTGDSQFYIPQHRILPLPLQERRTSVPEWLEQLPEEPDEFEKDEQDEDSAVALSPHVELERGSMRAKVRRQNRKKLRSNTSDEVMIDPRME